MPDRDFDWLANELCLDFHNTATWDDDGGALNERLDAFDALASWCVASGMIGDDALAELTADPDAILQQAYDLRAVIHDVFAAIARGDVPDPTHLAELNDFLASVVVRIEAEPGEVPVLASGAVGALSGLLAPIVWSAASLLVSPFRDKVGICANPECNRLFVDLSRRGNRNWCDMATCGNRAKASRHYARHRASSENQ